MGANVADLLIRKGNNVVILDNFSQEKIENINGIAKVCLCDILDVDKLDMIFCSEQPDVVIYNAAQVDL